MSILTDSMSINRMDQMSRSDFTSLSTSDSGGSIDVCRLEDQQLDDECVIIEGDNDPLSKRASFFIEDPELLTQLENVSGLRKVENISNGRRARSQFLQLFTCQNCCKRRRSPKTSRKHNSTTNNPDNCSPSSSHSSFKSSHSVIDSSNFLSVDSIRGRPSDDDDDSDGVGRKKTPRRSEKSKRTGRRSPIEVPGLLTSILKSRHSPSPIRADLSTGSNSESVFSTSVDVVKKSNPPPPIRIWETDSSRDHVRLEAPNSVLARCARLKNQSLYGSFSFQKAELQKFNATVTAAVEDENIGSSPSHRSLSESSSGSGSPYPWVNDVSSSNIGGKSSGGKRARFNEAVDVIVDDQRSGRMIFKNIIRLKPSADDSELELRGQHDGRKRLPSDSSDADFTLAALRCRRRQKAFGEARISIIPASRGVGSISARGKGGLSKRASTGRSTWTGHGGRPEAPTLRVAIRLKEEFTRDRVFVRTARGGTRLLVGTYRPEPLGDGTNYLRQFVDRYSLPHAIDVTTVTASLGEEDSPDDLVITAKLFDYESDDYDGLVVEEV